MNAKLILITVSGLAALAGLALWFAPRDRQPAEIVMPQPMEAQTARNFTNQTGPAPVHSPALIEAVAAETDDLVRNEMIESFVAAIPIGQILQELESLRLGTANEIKREIQRRLMRKWALAEPKAAAAWVVEAADRKDLLPILATAWAQSDAAGAAEWARSLPEADRDPALLKVAYAAISADPRTALSLARDMAQGDARDELVSHATLNWAAKNPLEAAKWAGQIEDQSLRERALAGVAASWGENDPRAAAELALSSLTPGKTQNDALMGIVQRWSQKDASNAAAWVAQFPEGALRETATEAIVKLWVDQDHEQAGAWIKSLPAGASRDRATSAYVEKIVAEFPEQAAAWAASIPDEATRLSEMERVARTWIEADGAAARLWISKSDLPEDIKARLVESE